jgi:hypothetical protein
MSGLFSSITSSFLSLVLKAQTNPASLFTHVLVYGVFILYRTCSFTSHLQLNLLIVAMKFISITTALALALVNEVASQAAAFNITAISAANNTARLECWQLDAPPNSGRGAVNFNLGDFDNAFVGILPPNTTTGTINNAVQVQ